MKNNTTLKNQINWNYWIAGILFFISLIIEDQAFGTYFSSWIYGLVLILVGILYTVRYQLYHPALIMGLLGLAVWHYFLASHFEDIINMLQMIGIDISVSSDDNPFSILSWLINAIVLAVLMVVTLPVLDKAFKLEKSARRLFKLAANTVYTVTDGFTSRPYSAGIAEYSQNELIGFTNYLAGKSIAFPLYKEKGIYLTFSMRRSPLSVHEPTEITYVYFDYDGKITVHISETDYRRYKTQLSFDQLNESMSNIFKRFFDHYKNNQENRINNELFN